MRASVKRGGTENKRIKERREREQSKQRWERVHEGLKDEEWLEKPQLRANKQQQRVRRLTRG